MKKSQAVEGSPVALVTGAGRRLGRQIAYALAEHGFDVVVNYNRSKRGAVEAVRHISSLGQRAIALKADVSRRQAVRTMVGKAMKYFRKIDLLVNNAGIFLYSPLEKTTDKNWTRVIDINLTGVFLCSQVVSREMIKKGGGRIINIASLGGLQAWSKHLPYSVSKAGVIMLTRCMAKALAPGIMVNAIAPGTIIIPGEEDPRVQHVPVHRIPLKRYGKPSDITSVVVYLANTSEYITGQTFVVDGGSST